MKDTKNTSQLLVSSHKKTWPKTTEIMPKIDTKKELLDCVYVCLFD
ncbi:hypothetical protein C427_2762 [Paraglaciecola psychrophila 170]|uniref:Uncharacterized protein n=1 Tax=Paraglaciecola psychrophila 170 TaxID=1129794 RepID=K6ZJS6_9ALTE|nr:hypothetical protein C427_2762 [Paraglaciecola psychrophila 170]GAC36231.1 hypothetical protein GPSY_0593 [Paraglaciecola psychrophila 170]